MVNFLIGFFFIKCSNEVFKLIIFIDILKFFLCKLRNFVIVLYVVIYFIENDNLKNIFI